MSEAEKPTGVNELDFSASEPSPKHKGVWINATLEFDEELAWNEKVLISIIDSLCARGEACFAGNEYLAKRLQVKLKHMNNMIAELTVDGFLTRLKFTGRKTFRCVHSHLSSDPGCVHSLLARYNTGESSLPLKRKAGVFPQKGMQPSQKRRRQRSPKGETEEQSIKQRETTTTEPPAQAKHNKPNGKVVVVPILSLVPREGDKRHTDIVDALVAKYGLDQGQAYKLQELADREGIEFVLEKDALTQSKTGLKSTAGFFIKACALDWKASPPSAADKPTRKKRAAPPPEPEPEPEQAEEQCAAIAAGLKEFRKELAQAS